ncbi:Uncharacterised protein [Mycobacteroides abscessus subsp. abscessus]|nr:Uncharacterised protein [Mycobacteroides abscessus subsp. abscessus]
MCLVMICNGCTPIATALVKYSFSFTDSTADLTSLVKTGVKTIPMAIIVFVRLGPKTATMVNASKMSGKAKKTSMTRMIT